MLERVMAITVIVGIVVHVVLHVRGDRRSDEAMTVIRRVDNALRIWAKSWPIEAVRHELEQLYSFKERRR